MRTMKLAFVNELHPPLEGNWQDGQKAALDYLAEHNPWEIRWFKPEQRFDMVEFKPDIVLVWGGTMSIGVSACRNLPFKKAMFYAGGPIGDRSSVISEYDCVWFLGKHDYDQSDHENKFIAFGGNHKLFFPVPTMPKKWDAIYSGAFAGWKRVHLFTEALKGNGVAVGQFQEQEMDIPNEALQQGVSVFPFVPPQALLYFYNSSKVVVVPADAIGGGERSVVDAWSCGLPVVICEDAPKLTELFDPADAKTKQILGRIVTPTPEAIRKAVEELKDSGGAEIRRQFVLDNYSIEGYANAIKTGIRSVVGDWELNHED